jgi:hypothetical protein
VRTRPGTSLWLLRHELRLFWRSLLSGGKSDGRLYSAWRAVGWGALFWLGLHVGVFFLLRATGVRHRAYW